MPTRTDTADGARELGRWNLPNSNTSPHPLNGTECSAGPRHANAHPHGRRGSATRPLEPPNHKPLRSPPNTHWVQCWPTPCQRAPTRQTGLGNLAAGTSQSRTRLNAAQHALSVVLAYPMPTRTDTADAARPHGRWNLPNSNPSARRPTRTECSAGLPHANAHPHGPPKVEPVRSPPNTHWV